MDDPGKPGLPIVGIGASAGGIEAFRGFFENMPPDSGMGFVVVLHLSPDKKSVLPEILARWTSMRIIEVVEGCRVEANRVYVPPAGVGIVLRNGHLHLLTPASNEPRELSPISIFFDSLAASLREDAIGIVLSGTGSDGALGLKAIKTYGGLTLAQGTDGTAPQYEGMPASAIATGAVDIVASVEAMPGHILTVQSERQNPSAISAEQVDAARLTICSILQREVAHDFSGYKEKTFLRRVRRRMQVVAASAFPDYIDRLERDHAEVMTLFRDLLIGVTSFFRDASVFEVIKREVLPRLFKDKGADATVRVWVPGCSTGEEAYSLAMLMREHVDTLEGAAPRIQVFASDIDEPAISTARAGRYPATLLEGLSPERRSRFFVAGPDGSFAVGREARELCTFSAHSLTRDPPFSKIDLVSCRNLLIYLDSELQAEVIPAFHYALVPDGILLLGSSENVSRHAGLFTPLDKANRIFQKRGTVTPPLRMSGRATAQAARPAEPTLAAPAAARSDRAAVSRVLERVNARVLERFGPAFVVCGADGEIVHFSSGTGKFLESVVGVPTQNVLTMARRGLRGPLRAALKRAVETGRPVEVPRVALDAAGEPGPVITLALEPRPHQGANTLYLVAFVEADGQVYRPERAGTVPLDPSSHQDLEAELRETREQLQTVSEEHETALEELRSANEEYQSVNEELQSANEELETSKEEIQSINEELQTVNSQLGSKVEELDRQNTDLHNLFESTQVATVFLDPYLVIRGFTPAVASLYNLIPSDQGRPITDIVTRLDYAGLREDVGAVLDTLKPMERRVARADGSAHYLMRILPYRTPDSSVDGTIITFVDVTSIVAAEQHQRLLVDELNHRVKNMLTVVISMASQTMRHATTMDEFSANYIGRLHALNAAYSLLSGKSWRPVSVREIVSEEVAPFLNGSGTNISVEGPTVPLEPTGALALGMAIHELTTNAVKYGALSVTQGLVCVTWHVEQRSNGSQLVLGWVEKDGPVVSAPSHRGFGMTLIERGLKQDMSALVHLDFDPAGVRATVTAPLTGEPSPGPPIVSSAES